MRLDQQLASFFTSESDYFVESNITQDEDHLFPNSGNFLSLSINKKGKTTSNYVNSWPELNVLSLEEPENEIPTFNPLNTRIAIDENSSLEESGPSFHSPEIRVAAVLTADQEVTPSDNPMARGTSVLKLNRSGNALSYELTIFNLDFGQFIGDGTPFTLDTRDDVTKVHIHNAFKGENGPLAFAPIDLSDPSLDNQDADDLRIFQNANGSVTLTGRWELTDPALISLSEFVTDFRNAEQGSEIPLYWNIHTEGSPAGAIRGQFLERGLQPPVQLSSHLTASQEVSPSNNPNASGISTLSLNRAGDALSYTITVFGLDFGQLMDVGTPFTSDTSDDVTKVHIHTAVRGENGPLAFAPIDLSDPSINNQDIDDLRMTQNEDGSVTLQGIWETSDPVLIPLSNFVNEIRSTHEGQDVPLYWNIHTQGSPAGAIRGQWQVDSLAGGNIPNVLTAAYHRNHLQGSTGFDRFVIEEYLVTDNLRQHFIFSDFEAIDEFELGSATIMSSVVLGDDRLIVSLSGGDTLTFIGNITAVHSQLLGI